MLRLLKILAWSVAGLMIVFAAVLVGVSLFVDPNDYKQDIARAVQDRTGRQFDIRGDLEVSVFPWLGVEAGGVSLSNPAGFDDDPQVADPTDDDAAERRRADEGADPGVSPHGHQASDLGASVDSEAGGYG